MTSPARDNRKLTPAQVRLVVLKLNLDGRGVLTHLDADSLAVLDPANDETVNTIYCRPWPLVQDALWFFDCMDEPVADAGDIIGAAVAILGDLHRLGVQVHG